MSESVSDPAHYRERVYEIFAEPEDEPGEKIRRALSVGMSYLDLPVGFCTRIEDGTQEIVYATGEHPLIQPGECCPLDEAYCRRTVRVESALAVQDAESSATISAAATETFDLQTYLGAKVTVEDDVYGTVCFASRSERASEFTRAETHFVELLAKLVGQAIERGRYEQELKSRQRRLNERNQMVSVLNRVLRHNLRNEMNVMTGYAEALRDRVDGDEAEYASRIIETGADLVELSETARTLESSLNRPAEPTATDIVSTVRQVAAEIRERYPAATVAVETPESAVARSGPRLETALVELVENAAEHAGEAPSIELTVRETHERVVIEIRDDGPGLPEHEREVLRTGEETTLVHGSGLDLWVAHWLVETLGGTLQVSEGTPGACIGVCLSKPTAPPE
jgi:signal transduction histidine kinase